MNFLESENQYTIEQNKNAQNKAVHPKIGVALLKECNFHTTQTVQNASFDIEY